MEEAGARFVLLTTVGDLTEGRVLAARLESEGIEVRVHSPSLGPYPVTVGDLAETELWVLSDRIEEASRIVLDAEVATTLASAVDDAPRGLPIELRLIALAVGAVFVALWILRVLRVY